MANVLGDEKKHQVLALGRLGWSLRRIEKETGVRRETASAYLRAAGIAVRRAGGRPAEWPPKPATTEGVSTDSGQWPKPGRAPASSVARGVLPALNARARHEVDRAKPPARSLQRCSRLSTGARGASAAPVRTRNRGIWFELDHLNNLNRSEESG